MIERIFMFSARGLALAAALLLGVVESAAESCTPWVSSSYGFSVCRPSGWYHRTMRSGALFLCSEPHGNCTSDGGGAPLAGQATLALVPAQIIDRIKDRVTILELAHRVADKDASSQFSEITVAKGLYTAIEYLFVKQTFTTGALNETPQEVYRYFGRSGQQMVEVILTFNEGDRRSAAYRKVALDLMMSLHSN
jgi:hypothetical protein